MNHHSARLNGKLITEQQANLIDPIVRRLDDLVAEPPLYTETGNLTGWGLLCALAGCDDLELPVMGSEYAIAGDLDVVSYDNTNYLELL